MSVNIRERLHLLSKSHSDHLAVADGAGVVTFAMLEERVSALTTSFKKQGVVRGSTVLFCCLPGIDFYAAMFSVFALGARVMLVDPGFSIRQILACLRQVKPDFVVGLPGLLTSLSFFGTKFLSLRLTEAADGAYFVELSGEEDALITFTSGTTGEPRMIVRSQRFLCMQHKVLEKSLDLKSGNVVLTTLPVFVLSNLAAGLGSVLVSRRKANLNRALELLLKYHADRIIAAPDFLDGLRNEARLRGVVLSFVRAINVGGGPVFPRSVERWSKVFPEAKILSVYGGSEAEPISTLLCDAKTISAALNVSANGGGLPAGKSEVCRLAICPQSMFEIKADFSESEFEEFRLKAFERGEILVTGDHVVKVGSCDKVRVGNIVYHRTGDAGYLDEEGSLYLVGRAKYSAKRYPLEIEAMVRSFAQVRHCAYLASEDTLFVDQNLPRMLLEKLASMKIEVRRIKAIPVDRRHGSKVVYTKLENLKA